MDMIYFRIAGDIRRRTGKVFLQSRNRLKSLNRTIFHRNDWNTDLRIPIESFKKNFKYEHFTGTYRTELCYCDLVDFAEVTGADEL